MNSIVIHYKELALKGRNRPWFIQRLVRNLRVALGDLGVRSVRSMMGRIEIDLPAFAEASAGKAVGGGSRSISIRPIIDRTDRTPRSPSATRRLRTSR